MANQTLHSLTNGQQVPPFVLIDGPAERGYEMTPYAPIHSTDDIPQTALNDGYAAAQAWYVDMMERAETLCREESA